MGLGKTEKKTYLSIAFGRLRQRTTKEDTQSELRLGEDGTEYYERVYNFIEGFITNLFYKVHQEYGNSFEVTIDDGKEKFNLSFKENSRYCQDLLTKLPLIDLTKPVMITPFDFVPADKTDNIQGTSIKQDGVKIGNFFVQKVDDKLNYSHGYPATDGKLDTDDFKIHMIKVKKFLRNYTEENIMPKIKAVSFTHQSKEIEEVPLGLVVDDLPF